MSAPVRLAVLGDPLRFTLSPELHRAGCAALGLACESRALRTPADALGGTLARLAAEGLTGCNLTMPLKEAALPLVHSASDEAVRARSVNTVTFRPEGPRGDTTDGAGFVGLLAETGLAPRGLGIVVLGSGGAARSLAWALSDAGAAVGLVSRHEPGADARAAFARGWRGWGTPEAREALAAADVLVNATPLGLPELGALLGDVRRDGLVVDLAYGADLTPWVREARARGLRAVDGLGLLVHQARRSLGLWLGRDVPLAPLAAAVGWPR
jgi:shikimate dehydrogenase